MSSHESLFATPFVDYVNSILEKCNVKWKSKSHPCNTKSHVGSLKFIEKSNNHDGGARVTREVNGHPICYIYTLIAHAKEFQLGSSYQELERKVILLEEQVVSLMLHYWG